MKVRTYFNISALSARVADTHRVSLNTKYHTRLPRDEHYATSTFPSVICFGFSAFSS